MYSKKIYRCYLRQLQAWKPLKPSPMIPDRKRQGLGAFLTHKSAPTQQQSTICRLRSMTMLVEACRQDTKVIKGWFWRLSTAAIPIISYPASDNSHNGSWVTRMWNTLCPNNMIGRRLTTQNRITPSKKPKKDKGRCEDEGDRQQRIPGKAVLPESSKACTTRAFIY